jgi:hypothetical protein
MLEAGQPQGESFSFLLTGLGSIPDPVVLLWFKDWSRV